MFKFTYEWVMSMAKYGLLSRGVSEDEAESMLNHGDSWLGAEKLEAARAEILNIIADCEESINWTENNFLPGPNSDKYVADQQVVIERLTEYVNEHLGGMSK